ncbi:radical SAM/SPASM domain-containing protein [Proteiniclasticum ruminis]|uniref:Radical SAM additional 4Fe4S-binding SPASM domain-containing protein n=1 Tax=Proteiniclasticum ruminis TaxID=398199 RepID=A0A1G8LLT7_9CLOT|nr:radical SAM/SPASM domain-containing protein [Proteiniclasticum ruminis]SDI56585.1 radical SAM additional 4Fe4S-binding SPASM domain-containing protein [Proteiniclasticum ruminis]
MPKYKKIYMEITSTCNLSCSFCPETKRPKSFLSVAEFERRLEEVKPYTDHVYLHVKGEPLLHPALEKLLDLCMENKIQVNLTTNGTLLSKHREMLLKKPALRQVNFSLHSLDGNEEERDKGSYMRTILDFAKEASQKGHPIVSLRFWNIDPSDLLSLDARKNRALLEMIEEEFQLEHPILEKVQPGRGLKLAEGIYINQDHEFQWPALTEEEDDGKGFCYGLKDQVGILTDGIVVPCCLDGEGIINLGNIKDTPFREIIESERAKNLTEGFSRRTAVEELCRKCGYRKRFGK